jgi:site-specific DNA-methyltransferase (adenine-specific)
MIIQGDCLEVMKDIEDKSINLVVADSPYNIKKADWDKWKRESDYIDWCLLWIKECERVLKDNGSFYFFHNDMTVISKLMGRIEKETKFVFKQMIIWNKRFPEASNKGFLDGFVVVDGLRNYQQMCEYCLFYTFQDETGLSTVMLDINNFSTMRRYFKELLEFINKSKIEIITSIGQQADHCFRWKSSQWDLPTKETYNELIEKFNIKEWEGFKEYESLRQEYESLRYTFNNQKTHHSVWDYEIAPRVDHVTPKPLPLIENIIKHSSNEGDVVLDPFLGSGTTAVACKKLNRICIGIEKESKYIEIANKRLIE